MGNAIFIIGDKSRFDICETRFYWFLIPLDGTTQFRYTVLNVVEEKKVKLKSRKDRQKHVL